MPGGEPSPRLRPPAPPDPPTLPPPPPLSGEGIESPVRPNAAAWDCTQDIAMCALSLITSPS